MAEIGHLARMMGGGVGVGDPELVTVWKDAEFAKQQAFYYARAIEIPTPRGPAYDAKRFGVTMDAEVPMTRPGTRGYTSPIWYTS